MGGGHYDVFISYARGDAAAAEELNTWLRGQKFQATMWPMPIVAMKP
jgi:hypothetical protein